MGCRQQRLRTEAAAAFIASWARTVALCIIASFLPAANRANLGGQGRVRAGMRRWAAGEDGKPAITGTVTPSCAIPPCRAPQRAFITLGPLLDVYGQPLPPGLPAGVAPVAPGALFGGWMSAWRPALALTNRIFLAGSA